MKENKEFLTTDAKYVLLAILDGKNYQVKEMKFNL